MLTLERFAYAPYGTFGRMTMPSGAILYTIEDPWNDNKVGLSSIPEGIYTVKPSIFHRGGYECHEIQNVPNRSLIKIHIANTQRDVRGCIGIGTHLGTVSGLWAVLDSRIGFNQFMSFYRGKAFDLTISHYAPFLKDSGDYRVSA